MNTFWSYFLPLIIAGLVIGVIAGVIAFRRERAEVKDALTEPELAPPNRRRRSAAIAVGILLSLGVTALWSGPMGAANLFIHRVERDARLTLDNYEIPEVSGHLHRQPLSRRLILNGPADDFQRSELTRIMPLISGVREAHWTASSGGLPMIVESGLASLLGFLFGALLAYLVELRRRHNAQWSW